jgi:hypothetical protein
MRTHTFFSINQYHLFNIFVHFNNNTLITFFIDFLVCPVKKTKLYSNLRSMAYRMITSFVVTLVLLGTICDAQLSSTFYDSTCPNALSTIRTSIRTAISKERRMAASLIRLHFHDCFVQVITIYYTHF